MFLSLEVTLTHFYIIRQIVHRFCLQKSRKSSKSPKSKFFEFQEHIKSLASVSIHCAVVIFFVPVLLLIKLASRQLPLSSLTEDIVTALTVEQLNLEKQLNR